MATPGSTARTPGPVTSWSVSASPATRDAPVFTFPDTPGSGTGASRSREGSAEGGARAAGRRRQTSTGPALPALPEASKPQRRMSLDLDSDDSEDDHGSARVSGSVALQERLRARTGNAPLLAEDRADTPVYPDRVEAPTPEPLRTPRRTQSDAAAEPDDGPAVPEGKEGVVVGGELASLFGKMRDDDAARAAAEERQRVWNLPRNRLRRLVAELGEFEAKLRSVNESNAELSQRVSKHEEDAAAIKGSVIFKQRQNTAHITRLQEQLAQLTADRTMRKELHQTEMAAQAKVAAATAAQIAELEIMVNFRDTALKQTKDSVEAFEGIMRAVREREENSRARAKHAVLRHRLGEVMSKAKLARHSGLAPVIVEEMAQFPDSALVQREALAALQHLQFWDRDGDGAVDPYAQARARRLDDSDSDESIEMERFSKDDMAPLVTQAMRNFPDNLAIQIEACRILWKVAVHSPQAVARLCECGGVQLALRNMRVFADSRRLFYNALGALRAMLNLESLSGLGLDAAAMPVGTSSRHNGADSASSSRGSTRAGSITPQSRGGTGPADSPAAKEGGAEGKAVSPLSRAAGSRLATSTRSRAGLSPSTRGTGGSRGTASTMSPSSRSPRRRRRRGAAARRRGRRASLSSLDAVWHNAVEFFMACLDVKVVGDAGVTESAALTLAVLARKQRARAAALRDPVLCAQLMEGMLRNMDRPIVQACGCLVLRLSAPVRAGSERDAWLSSMRDAGLIEQVLRITAIYQHKVAATVVEVPRAHTPVKPNGKAAQVIALFQSGNPSSKASLSSTAVAKPLARKPTVEEQTAELVKKQMDAEDAEEAAQYGKNDALVVDYSRPEVKIVSGTEMWAKERWEEAEAHWVSDTLVSTRMMPDKKLVGTKLTAESSLRVALGEAQALLEVFGRKPGAFTQTSASPQGVRPAQASDGSSPTPRASRLREQVSVGSANTSKSGGTPGVAGLSPAEVLSAAQTVSSDDDELDDLDGVASPGWAAERALERSSSKLSDSSDIVDGAHVKARTGMVKFDVPSGAGAMDATGMLEALQVDAVRHTDGHTGAHHPRGSESPSRAEAARGGAATGGRVQKGAGEKDPDAVDMLVDGDASTAASATSSVASSPQSTPAMRGRAARQEDARSGAGRSGGGSPGARATPTSPLVPVDEPHAGARSPSPDRSVSRPGPSPPRRRGDSSALRRQASGGGRSGKGRGRARTDLSVNTGDGNSRATSQFGADAEEVPEVDELASPTNSNFETAQLLDDDSEENPWASDADDVSTADSEF